jgi:hypothetical protein
MTMFQRLLLLCLVSSIAVGSASAQTLETALSVNRGTSNDEVVLAWTGGAPTFEIFRSSDPSDVSMAGNEIGETIDRDWTDPTALNSLLFYRIGSRAPTVAERITIELLRPNDDPVGRPLPVAAHWNPGQASASQPGWDPDFVLDYLDAGEYVIPLFRVQMLGVTPEPWSYYESGLMRARSYGIPIAIRFTQWDRPFTDDPNYFGLPPADNPNVIDVADGTTIVAKTDPEGPIARWQEVGLEWGSLQTVAEIQAEYPDPPLVIWLNNFEQPRLRWEEAETSWRFVQNHGPGLTGEQTRAIVGQGWIDRDTALWGSLTDQLTADWQAVSIPICYSAFGVRKYGQWNGWNGTSLHVPGRFSPWPLVANGSASYYVLEDPAVHAQTDYRVDGPQMSGMNWNFMLAEALRDNPDYFWEVSSFDGGIQRQNWYRFVQGQIYDKARYKGFVRFGLWLTRPRVFREFRLTAQDRALSLEYWDAVLEAVREVHTDADLTRFWRNGELVVNPAHPHAFDNNLVAGYTDVDVDRNFLLDADVNPLRPWTNDMTIEVWSLALVLGEAPNREWLLFTYAPLQSHDDVVITVPGFGDVTVDVPRGNGVFVQLAE